MHAVTAHHMNMRSYAPEPRFGHLASMSPVGLEASTATKRMPDGLPACCRHSPMRGINTCLTAAHICMRGFKRLALVFLDAFRGVRNSSVQQAYTVQRLRITLTRSSELIERPRKVSDGQLVPSNLLNSTSQGTQTDAVQEGCAESCASPV